jgi:hypothetical protein
MVPALPNVPAQQNPGIVAQKNPGIVVQKTDLWKDPVRVLEPYPKEVAVLGRPLEKRGLIRTCHDTGNLL